MRLRVLALSFVYFNEKHSNNSYFGDVLVLEILTYALVCCGFRNFFRLKLALVIQFLTGGVTDSFRQSPD